MKYNEIVCKCKFCNKLFKNARGVNAHEYVCKLNPDRKTDFPKPSEETKKKISEARKKYIAEHPDRVPFKLNHSSKQSYPEAYFENGLKKEEIFDKMEFSVGRYTLDFAWPDKLLYLEIDGSQHSLDWMKEHDQLRTEYLAELGWKCICRVYWPQYQKYTLDEKRQYLFNLKAAIMASEFIATFKSKAEQELELRQSKLDSGEFKLDSRGRLIKDTTNMGEVRKQLILESGVDFTKFGGKTKVEQITGLTRRQVCLTIERFTKVFDDFIYIRGRE